MSTTADFIPLSREAYVNSGTGNDSTGQWGSTSLKFASTYGAIQKATLDVVRNYQPSATTSSTGWSKIGFATNFDVQLSGGKFDETGTPPTNYNTAYAKAVLNGKSLDMTMPAMDADVASIDEAYIGGWAGGNTSDPSDQGLCTISVLTGPTYATVLLSNGNLGLTINTGAGLEIAGGITSFTTVPTIAQWNQPLKIRVKSIVGDNSENADEFAAVRSVFVRLRCTLTNGSQITLAYGTPGCIIPETDETIPTKSRLDLPHNCSWLPTAVRTVSSDPVKLIQGAAMSPGNNCVVRLYKANLNYTDYTVPIGAVGYTAGVSSPNVAQRPSTWACFLDCDIAGNSDGFHLRDVTGTSVFLTYRLKANTLFDTSNVSTHQTGGANLGIVIQHYQPDFTATGPSILNGLSEGVSRGFNMEHGGTGIIFGGTIRASGSVSDALAVPPVTGHNIGIENQESAGGGAAVYAWGVTIITSGTNAIDLMHDAGGSGSFTQSGCIGSGVSGALITSGSITTIAGWSLNPSITHDIGISLKQGDIHTITWIGMPGPVDVEIWGPASAGATGPTKISTLVSGKAGSDTFSYRASAPALPTWHWVKVVKSNDPTIFMNSEPFGIVSALPMLRRRRAVGRMQSLRNRAF